MKKKLFIVILLGLFLLGCNDTKHVEKENIIEGTVIEKNAKGSRKNPYKLGEEIKFSTYPYLSDLKDMADVTIKFSEIIPSKSKIAKSFIKFDLNISTEYDDELDTYEYFEMYLVNKDMESNGTSIINNDMEYIYGWFSNTDYTLFLCDYEEEGSKYIVLTFNSKDATLYDDCEQNIYISLE